VRPIYDEIHPPPSPSCDDPNDISNASPAEEPSVVRYIHLHEEPDQYSVGIFVFPPNGKIPLHDHPGMCVLSRILYGDLQRRSLDLPPNDKLNVARPGEKRRAFYRTQPQPQWPLYLNRESSSYSSTDCATASTPNRSRIPVDHLVAPQCTVLYPREGNLHEFVAGPNGAAVLDVLLPPYDADHHRDCTFYEIEHCSSMEDENDPTSLGAAAVEQVAASRVVPCWIIPTGRPENFHCISGQYRELGEA
jgi:plant cysteine oxidase